MILKNFPLIEKNITTLKIWLNISQGFRLNNTDEATHYFIRKLDQNELMIKKHKKVFKTLNYI